MRKVILFIVAFIVLVAFLNPYPGASGAQSGRQSPQSAITGVSKMNLVITGKIIKEPDGYYIQGQTPREVFRIVNAVPNLLDEIVKSDQLVKIEARIVQGDNVDIQKIDGRTYQEGSKQSQ